MNSVLLIGDHGFTTGVVAQVRGLNSLTVTVVSDVEEALPVMAQAAPDVLIIQACRLTEGSVTKTFSIDRPSTYFVVIEDAIASSVELGRSPHYTSEMHLEKTAFTLEAGADAYLWLPPIYSSASNTVVRMGPDSCADSCQPSTQLSGPSSDLAADIEKGHLKVRTQVSQHTAALLKLHPGQRRLIQAHIQLGLNRAQRYRDLSRINDWLSAVALVDALTQLNNRRSFDLELPQKIKVARAKRSPLSLMVIDIDRFKSVNDRYGHLVGDDVLKMLAKRLLTNMRFYDTPFRYGGEEFVVTLSNTDLMEGIVIAQRLRQSIAQNPFQVSASVSAATTLPLTISIGLTELRADDDELGRSCLHRADQYLLKAKAEGRNRVVSD